jgi:hypothetical protein
MECRRQQKTVDGPSRFPITIRTASARGRTLAKQIGAEILEISLFFVPRRAFSPE